MPRIQSHNLTITQSTLLIRSSLFFKTRTIIAMFKFLITGLLVYCVYKFMYQPSLKEGPPSRENGYTQEPDTRNTSKNPRVNEEDYIDYEEVD